MKRASSLRRERAETRGFKKRRLELRTKRGEDQGSKELRKGTSYSSWCMLLGENLDTESIPSHIEQPEKISCAPSQEAKYILFDLETTSLSKESEIVQIAARECGKERSFSAFLMPEGAISAGASAGSASESASTQTTRPSRPWSDPARVAAKMSCLYSDRFST